MPDTNKYHVTFEDPNSGEELGLILREEGGAVQRTARLANPYAAKVGGGDRTLSDLTDLSAYGQADWRGGQAQDRFEEEDRFYRNHRIETRIKGQVTLGPLEHWRELSHQHRGDDVENVSLGKTGDTYTGRAQDFPILGYDPFLLQYVYLMMRKTADGANRTYTVEIRNSSGGVPTTLLATTTFELDDLSLVYEWVPIQITATYVEMLPGNSYFICVLSDGAESDTHYLEWAADPDAGYTGGVAAKYTGSAWEADATRDFTYWALQGSGATSAGVEVATNPVEYDGSMYAASYSSVFKWSGTTWVPLETLTGAVTAILSLGGYLWVARGNSQNVRRYDGSSWADAPGPIKAQLLYAYNGYLYRTDPANQDTFYYTVDGTNWSSGITVGQGELTITGLAGFRDELAIATERGLWLQAANWTYQVLDWTSQTSPDNGRALTPWARSNELMIPIKEGLYRWSGATMVSTGPDEDAGLDPDLAGHISALCGTTNWLFVAINAGSDGYSSIMATQGRHWHEIYRSPVPGATIKALAYDVTSSPAKLWWGEGTQLNHMKLPDFTSNPYQYTGIEYAQDGYIELSTWGSELMAVKKDWRYVSLQAKNCTPDRTITVYYEIDRSGYWSTLGTIDTAHTLHTLDFPGSVFAAKTVDSGCTTTTIALASGDTTDMVPGDWCKIDEEIRQVGSITDSATFVLSLPLSSAPVTGTVVYGATPVGAEIRLRLRLATNDSTESPKLLALACYCSANVLDRWQITLAVSLDEKLRCLDGSPYPGGAAYLATELEKWITRQTPFTLHDVRGTQRTVKVMNAVELTPKRETDPPWRYSSTMSIGLVEV